MSENSLLREICFQLFYYTICSVFFRGASNRSCVEAVFVIIDTHEKSDCDHRRPQRRPPVRQKQKRYSRDRHDTHNHTDIDEKMKKEHTEYTRCNIRTVTRRIPHDFQRAKKDDAVQCKNDESSDKAEFFRQNAEYKVRALLRQKSIMALRSMQKRPAEYAARSDCDLRLDDVPAASSGIYGRIEKNDETADLVFFEHPPGAVGTQKRKRGDKSAV